MWKYYLQYLFPLYVFPSIGTPFFILNLFSQFFYQRSHLIFLSSFISLKMWSCRNTFFHYYTINQVSCSYPLPECGHPSAPSTIFLFFDSCYLGKWEQVPHILKSTWKRKENWTTTNCMHILNYINPWPFTGWLKSQWRRQAPVKTRRKQLRSWSHIASHTIYCCKNTKNK